MQIVLVGIDKLEHWHKEYHIATLTQFILTLTGLAICMSGSYKFYLFIMSCSYACCMITQLWLMVLALVYFVIRSPHTIAGIFPQSVPYLYLPIGHSIANVFPILEPMQICWYTLLASHGVDL